MIKDAITVKELYQACGEGNGFHTLFCTFVSDPSEVEQFKDLFHDKNKVGETVILG